MAAGEGAWNSLNLITPALGNVARRADVHASDMNIDDQRILSETVCRSRRWECGIVSVHA